MIDGAVIGFLVWIVLSSIGVANLRRGYEIDYAKLALMLFIFVGAGTSIGYLAQ
jgi:hypothetical protein